VLLFRNGVPVGPDSEGVFVGRFARQVSFSVE